MLTWISDARVALSVIACLSFPNDLQCDSRLSHTKPSLETTAGTNAAWRAQHPAIGRRGGRSCAQGLAQSAPFLTDTCKFRCHSVGACEGPLSQDSKCDLRHVIRALMLLSLSPKYHHVILTTGATSLQYDSGETVCIYRKAAPCLPYSRFDAATCLLRNSAADLDVSLYI